MLGGIFHFNQNLNITFCKQTVDTLIRLGLHYLPTSHKKDAKQIWVKKRKQHLKRSNSRVKVQIQDFETDFPYKVKILDQLNLKLFVL